MYVSELHKSNTEKKVVIENESNGELNTSNSFIGFENNVGIQAQNSTDKMITFWIKQGSINLQNCDNIQCLKYWIIVLMLGETTKILPMVLNNSDLCLQNLLIKNQFQAIRTIN